MAQRQQRARRVARKALAAVGVALLLAILGIFDGVGFHATAQEFSYNPDLKWSNMPGERAFDIEGQAYAIMSVDATFNPLLCPFYWLVGEGRILANFSVLYYMRSPISRYMTGESPYFRSTPSRSDFPTVPVTYIPSQQDRIDYFVTWMATRYTVPNLALLLTVAAAIEIMGKRFLYLIFVAGIIGFYLAGVYGTFIGLVAAALIYKFKLSKNEKLAEFWNSLWKDKIT